MKTGLACCAYEFEYLSEVKLNNRRTNCFMSTIELKIV